MEAIYALIKLIERFREKKETHIWYFLKIIFYVLEK